MVDGLGSLIVEVVVKFGIYIDISIKATLSSRFNLLTSL